MKAGRVAAIWSSSMSEMEMKRAGLMMGQRERRRVLSQACWEGEVVRSVEGPSES